MARLPEFNLVKQAWADGRPALAAWMTTSCPLLAETIAATGHDAVVIDMQHSLTSLHRTYDLVRAIELGGAEPFVRLPGFDTALIGQLLDAGVTGIIVPMIETADQTRAFTAALRYPPSGTRSAGARRPPFRFGETYTLRARETIIGFAMIETINAVARLASILEVDGLDGAFVGPADLSMSHGEGPGLPLLGSGADDAIATIHDAAHKAGLRSAIFGGTVEHAARRLSQGFDFITTPSDLAVVRAGACEGLAMLKSGFSVP